MLMMIKVYSEVHVMGISLVSLEMVLNWEMLVSDELYMS
jgi:hypothetical protein